MTRVCSRHWRQVHQYHTESNAGVDGQAGGAKASSATVLRGAVSGKRGKGPDGADVTARSPGAKKCKAQHTVVALVKVCECFTYAAVSVPWEFFSACSETCTRARQERRSATEHVCVHESATPSSSSTFRTSRRGGKVWMSAPVAVEFDLSHPEASRACKVASFAWEILV